MDTTLTTQQTEQAPTVVAEWLGPQMGYAGPAPTGRDAEWRALGRMLEPEWDWPSSGPPPTILLEGGPEDWAIRAGSDLAEQMRAIGVFAELNAPKPLDPLTLTAQPSATRNRWIVR